MIVSRYLIKFRQRPSGEYVCCVSDGGMAQIPVGLIGQNEAGKWFFTPEEGCDYGADALRMIADFTERLKP